MFRSSFACIVIGGGGLGWVEPTTAAYGGRGLRRSSSVPKALTTVNANSPQIRVAPRVFFIVTRSVGLWPSVGHYRDFINFPLVFHRRNHRVMDCYLGDSASSPHRASDRDELRVVYICRELFS
uniref:(northern house mosquito) hypothetical protein n=1 Tax=Culex pipiens TaxID=7175 RepID=A0A8D8E1M0_CULPI